MKKKEETRGRAEKKRNEIIVIITGTDFAFSGDGLVNKLFS